jgi:hypothetical protein
MYYAFFAILWPLFVDGAALQLGMKGISELSLMIFTHRIK